MSYDAIKDFKAHFVQESSIKSWNAEQVQKAEGMVYLKKGGKMFWDYQSPTPQQIISDGRQLWFYEPEDKQVMVTTVGEGLQSQVSADLLNGKALLIGCPKLDDGQAYLEKLTAMLRLNEIKSLTVAHMEVPCCSGLIQIAKRAIVDSGKEVALTTVRIGIQGDVK